MATIKRLVTFKVDDDEMFNWFMQAMWERSKEPDESKNQTYWLALSHLVGLTDVEAVKAANGKEKEGRITVAEFRKWLPETLSRFAKDVIGVDDDD